MYSHDGRYVMVFNGEVYNYQTIQKEKLTGLELKTTSDSEVILECFVKYGVKCFEWFNGMFAIVIWDTQKEQLTIARDAVGIKPIYYFLENGNFAFGSELKTIKCLVSNLGIRHNAIPYFLHLGYIPHPFSMYENVWKFPAGAYAQLILGEKPATLDFVQFWKVENKIKRQVISDELTAKKQLNQILSTAVEKQLISDVPIGTFLSGGIDSSIVTAIASKVSKEKVKTFSIAVVDGKVNEAPYAAAIAKHLGTEHHEMPIKEKDILEMVPGFMEVYDEPFADSSAFPTMLVSKLARQQVTVALSGDGGDELFMGYGFYTWAKRLHHPMVQLLHKSLYQASKLAPAYYQRAGKIFNYPLLENSKSHIFSQEYFDENDLKQLLTNKNFDFGTINANVPSGRILRAEEQQSFWDIENYLKDDLLVKVDRASMQFSLETRVPLLDNNVVEFSLNLDSNLKVKNGEAKYLLKEVLYDYVPKSFFDRPKWGFGIPLEKWFLTELSFLYNEYFSAEMIDRFKVIDLAYFLQLKTAFEKSQSASFKGKVWSIIVLNWWLDKNS